MGLIEPFQFEFEVERFELIRISAEQIALQGPVTRSLVSANRWLRGIKTYRVLRLVSANHASSNPAQFNYNFKGAMSRVFYITLKR